MVIDSSPTWMHVHLQAKLDLIQPVKTRTGATLYSPSSLFLLLALFAPPEKEAPKITDGSFGRSKQASVVSE